MDYLFLKFCKLVKSAKIFFPTLKSKDRDNGLLIIRFIRLRNHESVLRCQPTSSPTVES